MNIQNNFTSILDTRTKSLDGLKYSYKTAGSNFGLDTVFPDKLDVDENKMAFNLLFAEGTRRDGVGDLLNVEGIVLDRHRVNPCVLFDHGKKIDLPVAMALEWDSTTGRYDSNKYTVQIDPITKKATCWSYFYQGKGLSNVDRAAEYNHSVFCLQTFDMIVQGMLRGGSIGYQIISAYQLPPDYEKGTPQGMHLQKVLMLEASVVVLPANALTVQKFLCSGAKCCGKSLSPYLIKSLSPYALPRKAQLGYEGKAVESLVYQEGNGPNNYRVYDKDDSKRMLEGRISNMESGLPEGKARELAKDRNAEREYRGNNPQNPKPEGIKHYSIKGTNIQITGESEDYDSRKIIRETDSETGEITYVGKPRGTNDPRHIDEYFDRVGERKYRSENPQNPKPEGIKHLKSLRQKYSKKGIQSYTNQQVEVPLDNVRTYHNIPPVKWKPGLGAIGDKCVKMKALRQKYTKSQPPYNHGDTVEHIEYPNDMFSYVEPHHSGATHWVRPYNNHVTKPVDMLVSDTGLRRSEHFQKEKAIPCDRNWVEQESREMEHEEKRQRKPRGHFYSNRKSLPIHVKAIDYNRINVGDRIAYTSPDPVRDTEGQEIYHARVTRKHPSNPIIYVNNENDPGYESVIDPENIHKGKSLDPFAKRKGLRDKYRPQQKETPKTSRSSCYLHFPPKHFDQAKAIADKHGAGLSHLGVHPLNAKLARVKLSMTNKKGNLNDVRNEIGGLMKSLGLYEVTGERIKSFFPQGEIGTKAGFSSDEERRKYHKDAVTRNRARARFLKNNPGQELPEELQKSKTGIPIQEGSDTPQRKSQRDHHRRYLLRKKYKQENPGENLPEELKLRKSPASSVKKNAKDPNANKNTIKRHRSKVAYMTMYPDKPLPEKLQNKPMGRTIHDLHDPTSPKWNDKKARKRGRAAFSRDNPGQPIPGYLERRNTTRHLDIEPSHMDDQISEVINRVDRDMAGKSSKKKAFPTADRPTIKVGDMIRVGHNRNGKVTQVTPRFIRAVSEGASFDIDPHKVRPINKKHGTKAHEFKEGDKVTRLYHPENADPNNPSTYDNPENYYSGEITAIHSEDQYDDLPRASILGEGHDAGRRFSTPVNELIPQGLPNTPKQKAIPISQDEMMNNRFHTVMDIGSGYYYLVPSGMIRVVDPKAALRKSLRQKYSKSIESDRQDQENSDKNKQNGNQAKAMSPEGSRKNEPYKKGDKVAVHFQNIHIPSGRGTVEAVKPAQNRLLRPISISDADQPYLGWSGIDETHITHSTDKKYGKKPGGAKRGP